MSSDRTISLADGIIVPDGIIGTAPRHNEAAPGPTTKIPLALSSDDLQELTEALASYIARQDSTGRISRP